MPVRAFNEYIVLALWNDKIIFRHFDLPANRLCGRDRFLTMLLGAGFLTRTIH